MDLSELWIGDLLLIKSQNLRGYFQGVNNNGLAIIKIKDSLVFIHAEDLAVLEEPQEEFVLSVPVESTSEKSILKLKGNELVEHVIDLHYEKLAPERVHNPHLHILEFQLEKCKEFIEKAIQIKFPFIRIIHGRGQGKLKLAVENLLKNYSEINFISSTPDQGAIEIWMK